MRPAKTRGTAMGRPRCLMLDVDGVLINGQPGTGASWVATLATDTGISPDALQRLFFRPHWDRIVTGRADLRAVLAEVLPHLSTSVTVDDFLRYWFDRDAGLDARVLAQVDQLRAAGMTVILATNQEHLRAADIMTRIGLETHVDGMIHSAALGVRKPDAAFFAQAQARSGFAAHDLLLIDDTRANVTAARAAGWRARLWRPGEDLVDLVNRT